MDCVGRGGRGLGFISSWVGGLGLFLGWRAWVYFLGGGGGGGLGFISWVGEGLVFLSIDGIHW